MVQLTAGKTTEVLGVLDMDEHTQLQVDLLQSIPS
jgi:hypothetical protein